ncbi:SusF/SusE family outer membrane protein [Ancylomarina longa]|uniref:SusF/SusE family outer membrane protein n=2 Tax=Ancylomarina longa TaxID=2487017 RepID=A0A434AYL6_9BACT|nr:SusF/SusE family outer membrane protein [Ancylomarina longa]
MMKKLNILFLLITGLFFTFSCTDDIEVMVPNDAIVPVLTSAIDGSTIVLSKINENDQFGTFEWTDADFKLDVAVQYALEVDVQGGDFAGHKTIATGITSPYSLSVSDMNKALLAAGYEDGQSYDISLRVVASNYLASEAISMTVTTYFDVEPYSVIGSAVGGWNPENDQYMSYDKTTDTYNITLDLKPGEFKFRAPKIDSSNPWAVNLGLSGDSRVIEEEANVALKQDGSNIQTNGGNYTLTLSVSGNTFSIVQNAASDNTDWTGVELDAVGDGVSADNADATADGSSWAWGNVLLADNGAVPTAAAGVYTWTWTGIVLEANQGFKLRTKNGEAGVNGINFAAGFDKIDIANSSAKVADDGGNITVTEKGAFDITITIDATNGDAKKIVIADPAPKYPAALYLIGDGVGDWDWNNTDLPMVPVNGTPNQFWKIVWMNATGGFKMASEKSWDTGINFGSAEDAYPAGGEYTKGGNNISVPGTAGYYIVVVDLDTDKISVVEPTVYLTGDAVGSWGNEDAANIFTVDNANEKLTITKTLAAAELRMFVAHPYFPAGDWWRTEFMVLDGAIVPRGNGGDQTRVSVAALETTIDLNFKAMTGTIAQ